MELWDAYNSNFEKIEGMTLVRGEEESIPEGVYHLINHILVKHVDGTFLLMKRDPRKAFPNMWEASAGGSALKGESPLESAFRELREETGIVADELTELRRFVRDKNHCFYVEYLCVTECAKDSIVLQEGETVDYKWVTAEELCRMNPEDLLSQRMRQYVEENYLNR